MDICYCGNSRTNHNFRHIFTSVGRVELNGSTVLIDRTIFKDKIGSQNCQCGKAQYLHGPILKHPYDPVKSFGKSISVTLPGDFPCLLCSKKASEHNNDGRRREEEKNIGNIDTIIPLQPMQAHKFTVEIECKDLIEDDVVIIRSADGDKIEYKIKK